MISRLKRRLTIAVGLWCAVAASAQTVRDDRVQARVTAVPKEFFGLTIHRAHLTTAWPTVPFGAWRLWDSYLKWSDIQPAPGVWKFEDFDRQVALGRKHDKELVYTLGQTPRWASLSADEKHAWGMGAGAMPRNIEDWTAYVEAVVSRYKGRIQAYEVWNEPKYSDRSGRCSGAIFFCGTPNDLVILTRTAHEIIRRIDPSARVATPAFTDGTRGVERLDEYLTAGGSKYVDAISFHFYELHPETAWETLAALRRVMQKHHLDHLPIWNSEVGFLIQNQEGNVQREHDTGPFSVVFSPVDAAARMARVHLVAAAGRVDRVYWYAWDDKRMGAIGSRDSIPNEVAVAYRVMRRWLLGSAVACENPVGGKQWTCTLRRDGRVAKVIWHDERKEGKFEIPSTVNVSVEQLNESRVASGSTSRIPWDGAPALISEDGKPWISGFGS